MDVADRLGALAKALADAGWESRARYESDLLQVFHPVRSGCGESVRVQINDAGCWCFVDSYGRELGLCSEVSAAAEALDRWLAATVGR